MNCAVERCGNRGAVACRVCNLIGLIVVRATHSAVRRLLLRDVSMHRSIQPSAAIVIVVTLIIGGCGAKQGGANGDGTASVAHTTRGGEINDRLSLGPPPLPMTAARNETASTVLQLSNLPKPKEK